MSQLLQMTGCKMVHQPTLGGRVPAHDINQETSVEGIYAAGDASGIEEASTAMIEGRVAGLAAAYSLGYLDEKTFLEKRTRQLENMNGLRSGPHGDLRAKAKDMLNAAMKR